MDRLKVKINNNENFQLIVSEPYFSDYKGEILYTDGFLEYLDKEINVQIIGVISGHKIRSIGDVPDNELLSICIPPIPAELESFKEDLCNSYILFIIEACELDLDIDNVSVFYPKDTLTIKVTETNDMLETEIIK